MNAHHGYEKKNEPSIIGKILQNLLAVIIGVCLLGFLLLIVYVVGIIIISGYGYVLIIPIIVIACWYIGSMILSMR